MAPIARWRYLLQVMIGQETHEKLESSRDLLGHAVSSGDLAGVLDRALDLLVFRLEKQKVAATRRSRPTPRPCARPRHIPRT